MIKAGVLGCGLVGSVMAKTLAAMADFDVTVADVAEEALAQVRKVKGLRTRVIDLNDARRVTAFAGECDILLGALPSRMGFQTLETIIRAGKSYCDISFMPEDATSLDGLAKDQGVTAVVDCGVSPGLSNMMVAHAASQLDQANRAVIFVGGLPKERSWPFAYKAPFAPSDVIEEYTRPARLVENGEIVERPALSDPELIHFPRVGTLEAFNTDGLRSLLKTVGIPNMQEKTLRHPGHRDLMHVFRETGLFGKVEIEIDGAKVRPLDVTSELLFPMWKLEPGEVEFTVLRVVVDGILDGSPKRYTYDLYDEYDRTTGDSSMARTTGFPNILTARLVAGGEFTDAGVFPPEAIAVRSGMFDRFIEKLERMGMMIELRIEDRD